MPQIKGKITKITLDKSQAKILFETPVLQDSIDFAMLIGIEAQMEIKKTQTELFPKTPKRKKK